MNKSSVFIILGIFLLFAPVYPGTWQDMTSAYPVMDSYGYDALCDGGAGIIFAGSWAAGGVYRTTDNGASWSQVNSQINFECLTIDPNTPGTLWGTDWNSSQMANISVNAMNPAITFQVRQNGMTGTSTHGIIVANSNSSQLICANSLGTYRTFDAGLNWAKVDAGNPLSSINEAAVFQSPWNADEYYLCGTSGVSVYSWSLDTLTLVSSTPVLVIWMTFDCATPGNYYFIRLDGAIGYYNKILGTTTYLTPLSGETQATRIENVCCCGAPVLYVSGRHTGVHLSTDNGITWQAYNSGITGTTSIYAFVPDCAEGYLWASCGIEGFVHGIWRNSICPYTPTITITSTYTQTMTNTWTATSSPTATDIQSPTVTATLTATNTDTVTPSVTQTSSATDTFTSTSTPSITATLTNTNTVTVTLSVTMTSSLTWTATLTSTPSITATGTVTNTVSFTPSATQTRTATGTYTATTTQTITATRTMTLTSTSTPTITPTRTVTVTSSVTDTVTISPTRTMTSTTTVSPTISPTRTPYPEGVLNVYPNPASIGSGGYVKFETLPEDSKVFIYTLSGELVTFYTQQMAAIYKWTCRNNYGRAVSPGIYYYEVIWNDGRDIRTGKIFLTQ